MAKDARDLYHSHKEEEQDRELVERAQRGDGQAFRLLFERYHRRLYALVYRMLQNREDAMDCVQEAFVKVYRHLPNFQGSASFYTWLYRIAFNLAIDQLRRRRGGATIGLDEKVRQEEDDDQSIRPRLLEENPLRTVLRQRLAQRIQEALDKLPPYHREVLLLREIEGMSYEEIAQVLDIPKGTVMSRLFHARRKVQDDLASYLEGQIHIDE
ncbi:MAG: sigma-70 family RNA polymerase sigma factor [Sandaracinaceae bacterium]|nr:sigma-70 family RNA polymerase sigma factor [Sandaracinaceae bacterium]